jgi:hypothetical protein
MSISPFIIQEGGTFLNKLKHFRRSRRLSRRPSQIGNLAAMDAV